MKCRKTLYLDLRTSDPSNGRKLILHEQMICFIVKPPLTNDQICASLFDHVDHIRKLLLLVQFQFVKFLDTRDIQLMLRLRAGRFESTGQNGQSGVSNGSGHLRVGHVLIKKYSSDECGVCKRTPDFAIDFDEIERDIASL